MIGHYTVMTLNSHEFLPLLIYVCRFGFRATCFREIALDQGMKKGSVKPITALGYLNGGYGCYLIY